VYLGLLNNRYYFDLLNRHKKKIYYLMIKIVRVQVKSEENQKSILF
jgi:hypothetical protein